MFSVCEIRSEKGRVWLIFSVIREWVGGPFGFGSGYFESYSGVLWLGSLIRKSNQYLLDKVVGGWDSVKTAFILGTALFGSLLHCSG